MNNNKKLFYMIFTFLGVLCFFIVNLNFISSLIIEQDFENGFEGWNTGSNVDLVSSGCLDGQCARVHYTGRGTGPYIFRKDVGSHNLQEVYVKFNFKIVNPVVGGCKFLKIFSSNLMDGITDDYHNLGTWILTYYGGNLDSVQFGPGTASVGDCQCIVKYSGEFGCAVDVNVVSSTSSINPQDGEWHCFEAYGKYNDPGDANGEYKVWYDGELRLHANGINNRGENSEDLIGSIGLADYSNHGSTSDEWFLFYDDVVISTDPIGCDGSGSDPPTEPYCGDGNCDSGSGEDCDNCPGDCLNSGQVCCSGIAYTGNCCSDSDCSSGWECVDYNCEEISVSENQTSNNSMNLYPTEDTYININTETLSQETTLNTYTWPENEIANAIIMKSDFSELSQDIINNIESAKLYLYQIDSGGDSNYDLSVHRIINHNPVISEANGYTYDSVNNWTSSNHRSDGISLAQGDISSALEIKTLNLSIGYKEFNITSLVNYWLENPSENYGLLINSDDSASSNSYRYFASSENSDSGKRPYVVIDYTNESSGEQNQTEEYHPADNNNDGVVDFSEISSYLDEWLNGNITIDELLSGINNWRGF